MACYSANRLATCSSSLSIARQLQQMRRRKLVRWLAAACACVFVLLLLANRSLQPHALDTDCKKIIDGDPDAIRRAIAISKRKQLPDDYVSDKDYAQFTCEQLTRGFWKSPVSELEKNFPIAFSMVVHKDFYQVMKLLQAVHRDHNAYCIHVDSKASEHFKQAVRHVSACLGNVHLTESRVEWGTFSVLEAQVSCLRLILQKHRTWKYVINIAGQEYPIRTLKEITEILVIMNGANNIEKLDTKQYRKHYPPINDTRLKSLRWYKGSVYAIISRPAVQYIAEDERAAIIYEHIRRNFPGNASQTVPDETYFATLNHNYDTLQFPGSYTGSEFTTDTNYRQIFRFTLWRNQCVSGLSVRGICILGVADLQQLNKSPQLVANKFYFDYQMEAYRCFQYRFWVNTRADYFLNESKTFAAPMQYYRNLEFVLHHAG